MFEQVTTGGASPVDILHCRCLDVAYVNFTRCTALTRSRALGSVVLTDSESASDIEAVWTQIEFGAWGFANVFWRKLCFVHDALDKNWFRKRLCAPAKPVTKPQAKHCAEVSATDAAQDVDSHYSTPS